MIEYIKHLLISTPLESPLVRVREYVDRVRHRKHPEIAHLSSESARITTILQRQLKTDFNCIDAGCHLGSFLSQIRKMCPAGHHFAIEPVHRKAQWLRRKFPDVQIVEAALSDHSGEADFGDMQGKSGYSRLIGKQDAGDVSMSRTIVQLKRLDEVIPSDLPIGFIKMDVEGAEYSALRGAAKIVDRWHPLILFECTKSGLAHFNVRPKEVFDVLAGYGYKIRCPARFLAGAAPMDAREFEQAMEYPFVAFNFFASCG